MSNLYIVIDNRDSDVVWQGTKKDCKNWIKMTNPLNRRFYTLVKIEEEK